MLGGGRTRGEVSRVRDRGSRLPSSREQASVPRLFSQTGLSSVCDFWPVAKDIVLISAIRDGARGVGISTTGLCAQHPGPSLTQASRQGAVPQAGGRAAEGGRAQQVEAFLAAVHDARAVHEALAGARLPVADGVVHEARVRAVDHWKRQRGTRVRDAPRRRAGGRRRTPPPRSEARRGRRPAGPPSSAPAEPAAARGHALQPGQADAAAAHAAREADPAAAAVSARPALHARAISRAEARGGVAPGDTRPLLHVCRRTGSAATGRPTGLGRSRVCPRLAGPAVSVPSASRAPAA